MAACAFAAVLLKVVSSHDVLALLTGIVTKALHTGLTADAGMVTAETAAVLPVLALLLAFALWAVGAGGRQVQCADAAREGARSAARGDALATTRAVALAAAPGGADGLGQRDRIQVRCPGRRAGAHGRPLAADHHGDRPGGRCPRAWLRVD